MKSAGYQTLLTADQAEQLMDIGHKLSAAAGRDLSDPNARFGMMLRLYLDTLALDAMAETIPGRRRKAALYTRRDLLQDMQQCGRLEALKEVFEGLRARGVIDGAIADAVRRDVELLKY